MLELVLGNEVIFLNFFFFSLFFFFCFFCLLIISNSFKNLNIFSIHDTLYVNVEDSPSLLKTMTSFNSSISITSSINVNGIDIFLSIFIYILIIFFI
jgi:hypothetical protein